MAHIFLNHRNVLKKISIVTSLVILKIQFMIHIFLNHWNVLKKIFLTGLVISKKIMAHYLKSPKRLKKNSIGTIKKVHIK